MPADGQGSRGQAAIVGNLPQQPPSNGLKLMLEAHVEFLECRASDFEPDSLDVAAPPDRPSSSIEQAIRTLIAEAGDDPYREGLRDTPARVARAYREWFSGYAVDPAELLRRVFTEAEDYDDTVLLRDIPFVSTCEHHLAPIMGKAHVAYRPDGRVVGISKLSRLVDTFARRLQLQERFTREVAQTLDEVLKPKGVAVIVEASHACMSTRGVNQHGVSMVTKCWLGAFKDDADLRRELMESIRCCTGHS
jgi:GTP cyclohydrolase I